MLAQLFASMLWRTLSRLCRVDFPDLGQAVPGVCGFEELNSAVGLNIYFRGLVRSSAATDDKADPQRRHWNLPVCLFVERADPLSGSSSSIEH